VLLNGPEEVHLQKPTQSRGFNSMLNLVLLYMSSMVHPELTIW
jgi:hypothetical protein